MDRLVAIGAQDVLIADVNPPSWSPPSRARFIECDVRQRLDPTLARKGSEIFSLAAVHRTPGHEDHEYFETNEAGARNIVRFAEELGARRLWFTSSIAVYGPSEQALSESSALTPRSAYGLSKLRAEDIYRRWGYADKNRSLVIVRPAAVFGPGEGGNFTRLASALARRRFVYPGRRTTLKACGFVQDLVDSMLFVGSLGMESATYNFAYPETPSIEEICDAFCDVAGYAKPWGTLPLGLLTTASRALTAVGASDYDPARVDKLVRSTHIEPSYLQAKGFRFGTDLRSALIRWRDTWPPGIFL